MAIVKTTKKNSKGTNISRYRNLEVNEKVGPFVGDIEKYLKKCNLVINLNKTKVIIMVN